MAKTVLLFLALLFTGATSYFSLTNLGKMKEERLKIHVLEGDIDKTMKDIDDTRNVIATRRVELNDENTKNGTLSSEKSALEGQVASFKAQIPQLEEEINQQLAEIKKYEDAIAELKKFFESMNVNDMEELNTKIKELEGSRIAREKELAETQALVEGANAANAKLDEQLGSARGRQMVRSRGLQANTSEAIISAVNSDWGFVVINAGENQGYRGDNILIVKRGDTFIGRLAITSLSKSQMVADIIPKSVPEGMAIMPGDRIILQKPNR